MFAARHSTSCFRTFLKMFHVKHFAPRPHFPIQKREKISPKISSTSTTPVSLCSENIATRTSSASNSAGASGLSKIRSSARRRGLEAFAVALARDQARMAVAHRGAGEIFQPLISTIEIFAGFGADPKTRTQAFLFPPGTKIAFGENRPDLAA